MPRKKTIQPPPPEPILLKNGINMEIWEKKHRVTYRGSQKRYEWDDKCEKFLEKVADDYFIPDPTEPDGKPYRYSPPKNDYLRNGLQFAKEMERRGFAGEEGRDTSSLRKKLYIYIKPNIEVYRKALEAMREGTSCAQ